jgi:hypothetical protein
MRRMFIPFGSHADLTTRITMIPGKNHRLLLPKYVYVLSRLIYYHTFMHQDYEKNGVVFNMQALVKILGESDSAAKAIMDNLVAWDYITMYKQYYAGSHSRSYKLHPKYEHGKYQMLQFTNADGKLISKLICEASEHIAGDELLQQQLSILCDRITISQDGLNFLKDKYRNSYVDAITDMYGTDDLSNLDSETLSQIPMDDRDTVLFSFLLGDFFAVRPDKESRIYTNLSSLKREYREFLLMDGKPIMSTDLVNSQIVFAIAVIEQHIKAHPDRFDLAQSDDLRMYRDYAQVGELYETVADFADNCLVFNDRRYFKDRFYNDVYFSKVSGKKSRVKDAFNMLYPFVSEVIADIKKSNHALFAVLCQRLEASVMIDTVLRQLMNMNVCALSIHDSIVVNNDADMELAERLITETMQVRHNVTVSFKRDDNAPKEVLSIEEGIKKVANAIKAFDATFDAGKWSRQQLKITRARQKKIEAKAQREQQDNTPVKFEGGTYYPKNNKVMFKGRKKVYHYGAEKLEALINNNK